MTQKAGVKCERFDAPKKVKYPLLLPIACVVVGAFALFWTYNHVSGNCLELTDAFKYCEFHTK